MKKSQLEMTPGSAESQKAFTTILTPEAIDFVCALHREFGQRREELLRLRQEVTRRLRTSAWTPDFLRETESIRRGDWKVAPTPADLQDRRVEITGPVERKMVINALNSGARVFMADFEDSHSPTWNGTIDGQLNLFEAIRRTISFRNDQGKEYALNENTAVLKVRPRGWHLHEKNFRVDGKPISGALFDFGLFFFHNAHELRKRGTGPYFYLPKMESYLEARLWNDVFNFAQDRMDLPRGTIRATVLIETILAAFQMDEILYELRDHSAGLNCGRWDYIFSVIKKFGHRPEFLMPDRGQVTMNAHFLRSYCELLIATCHRRGAHAMGGMAAQIPIKNDPSANEEALERVRADKLREVKLGHDGTWVAHPGLVPIALEVFNAHMPAANQVATAPGNAAVRAADLLAMPTGEITPAGILKNVNIALRYTEAWLRGQGCVPLDNLMEDAATAEISRAQLWQWIKLGKMTGAEFERLLSEESHKLPNSEIAAKLLRDLVVTEDFKEFLTLPAYELIS